MDRYPDAVFRIADGFDEAVLGMAYMWTESGVRSHVLCYDADRCVCILMDRDKMTREEAEEYFSFNVEDAYVGEGTPAFIWRS